MRVKLGNNFLWGLFPRFCDLKQDLLFLQRLGNIFLSLQFLNMMDSSFTILLPHSFNIQMKIALYPWTLLVSRNINFAFVIYACFSGNLLSFGKGLNWDKKYLLKELAFGFFFRVCNHFSILVKRVELLEFFYHCNII